MTDANFVALQVQLWDVYGPLAGWLIAGFFSGGILFVLLVYALYVAGELAETVNF